jgi:subtilisin
MKKNYLERNALHGSQSTLKKVTLPLLLSLTLLTFSCENENEVQKAPPPDLSAKVSATAKGGMIGINVLVNTDVNSAISGLTPYGTVTDVIPQIKALAMRIPSGNLSLIQGLSFVVAANPDAERNGAPIDNVAATDFSAGLNTWNLDAVNVTNLGAGRTVAQDGSGVFIGVLDSGLIDSWRQYFPDERIAEEYARAFGGGGGEMGNVSSQPNKWEHDQNSHGTHVTSTILGYKLGSAAINGVAPKATVIPVKVLNQNGSGWSSVIAQGIVYIAGLKAGVLQDHPVVINMSLGGSVLDAVESAAIDYAISKGVIIVASAGNRGTAGMGYPGAYAPVISAGSAGWKDGWTSASWWYGTNVPDPTNVGDLYISDFSSRAKTGQDLDVIAPGSDVVGPYQVNSGQLSYYYLSGTSMAAPHVTGIVALMAQVHPSLTAPQAETLLENAAIPMAAGSVSVRQSNGTTETVSWGADAVGHGFITADAAIAAASGL